MGISGRSPTIFVVSVSRRRRWWSCGWGSWILVIALRAVAVPTTRIVRIPCRFVMGCREMAATTGIVPVVSLLITRLTSIGGVRGGCRCRGRVLFGIVFRCLKIRILFFQITIVCCKVNASVIFTVVRVLSRWIVTPWRSRNGTLKTIITWNWKRKVKN